MATTFAFASSSPPVATFISSLRSQACFSLATTLPSRSSSPSRYPAASKKAIIFHDPFHVITRTSCKLGRIRAAPEDVVASETTQEIVSSTTDDGISVVISALLFAAFVGLSILTIGVIYLGVTDFLQKREREKFEKEEAAKGGKKKKKVVRARAGPRGFGQKIDKDEDDD